MGTQIPIQPHQIGNHTNYVFDVFLVIPDGSGKPVEKAGLSDGTSIVNPLSTGNTHVLADHPLIGKYLYRIKLSGLFEHDNLTDVSGFRFAIKGGNPDFVEYRRYNENSHHIDFYFENSVNHDHKNQGQPKNLIIHIDPDVWHPGGGGSGFP